MKIRFKKTTKQKKTKKKGEKTFPSVVVEPRTFERFRSLGQREEGVSRKKIILDPSAYGVGNARVSSGKICAGVAKIWLFGPHSASSLIQPKRFASFLS